MPALDFQVSAVVRLACGIKLRRARRRSVISAHVSTLRIEQRFMLRGWAGGGLALVRRHYCIGGAPAARRTGVSAAGGGGVSAALRARLSAARSGRPASAPAGGASAAGNTSDFTTTGTEPEVSSSAP